RARRMLRARNSEQHSNNPYLHAFPFIGSIQVICRRPGRLPMNEKGGSRAGIAFPRAGSIIALPTKIGRTPTVRTWEPTGMDADRLGYARQVILAEAAALRLAAT